MWCIMADGPRRIRPPRRGSSDDRAATLARVGRQGPDNWEGATRVIFKAVRDGAPYPDHHTTLKAWAEIPPRPIRLADLITTKRELALDKLLAEDSTFYGDLFPHAVQWHGELYLEDGLHRALRAALQQRNQIHARVLVVDG
jgi:Arc/MetJ family transcription regulator